MTAYTCETPARRKMVLAAASEDNNFFQSLKIMVSNDMMTLGKAKTSEVTYKEKRINEIIKLDTSGIGSYGKYGRAYIHIGKDLQKEYNRTTDTITARNREELILKLYDLFFAAENSTLNECFDKYATWRYQVGTKAKTLKEEQYEWNRFFRDTIGNVPVKSVTVPLIRDQLLRMTSNNCITRKRFNSAKAVLNGVLQYCMEQGFLSENPLIRINNAQFAKRFKPEIQKKDYSREEVSSIVTSLRDSDDPYDYAIRFAFNACLRFGELRSIKFDDIRDGILTISRSSSDMMPASLDASGKVEFGKTVSVETYTKGATNEGIRDFPLTEEALDIANKLHAAHPDWKYLFMSNGGQLKDCTFNRHLKKACDANGIEYRSSHVIRFTNCDALFNEAMVSKQSLQGYMGHSTPSMTDHYIARHRAKGEDNEKVVSFLRIG